jgi:hypothetical protein
MRDDLELVASFLQEHEARLSVLRLQSAGLEAELGDSGIVSVHPLLANAVGGVKVFVPKTQAARARALLAEAGAAAGSCMSCGAAMAETDERCAACGWSFLDPG